MSAKSSCGLTASILTPVNFHKETPKRGFPATFFALVVLEVIVNNRLKAEPEAV